MYEKDARQVSDISNLEVLDLRGLAELFETLTGRQVCDNCDQLTRRAVEGEDSGAKLEVHADTGHLLCPSHTGEEADVPGTSLALSDPLDDDELELLAELRRFQADEVDDLDEWSDAESNDEPTLIAESYFEDYAKEMAEDCGYLQPEPQTNALGQSWTNPLLQFIDWEGWADAVAEDYHEVTFGGSTFLRRTF